MKSNLNQIFDVSGLNPAEAAAHYGASAVIPPSTELSVAETPEVEVEIVAEPLSEIAPSPLPEFQPMSDDMTFGQAFAAARAAMGPGGSFSWHGQVYGTYYRNEWDAMTADQRHDFTSAAIEARDSYLTPEEPLYASLDDEPDFIDEDVAEAEVAVVGHQDLPDLSDNGSMVVIDLADSADSTGFIDLGDASSAADDIDMPDVF